MAAGDECAGGDAEDDEVVVEGAAIGRAVIVGLDWDRGG
jgi:hypothetical protein